MTRVFGVLCFLRCIFDYCLGLFAPLQRCLCGEFGVEVLDVHFVVVCGFRSSSGMLAVFWGQI